MLPSLTLGSGINSIIASSNGTISLPGI